MKRHIIFFAWLFLIFSCKPGSDTSDVDSSSNTPNHSPNLESPEISIQVEGLNGGMAYLIGIFADQQFGIDSAVVDGSGNMVFSRSEPYKPGLVFAVLPDGSNLQILVDADQKFELKSRTGSLIPSMVVSGSVDNKLLYDNLKSQMQSQPTIDDFNARLKTLTPDTQTYIDLLKQRDVLVDKRKADLQKVFADHPNTFYSKFKNAGQNPDIQDVKKVDGSLDFDYQLYLYRREFWDNVDFSDERLLSTPVIHNKLKRFMNDLTPMHHDSVIQSAKFIIDKTLPYPDYFKFISNWIAINYEPGKVELMDAEAVRVFLVQNYFTNERAFWADSLTVYSLQKKAMEMEASLIGKKGPDVQAGDPQGNPKSIYGLKSPYIVVFMFNPDCDHCQEEAPKLIKFHDKWKGKGVEVFTIAVETDEVKWKNFISSYNLKGTHVFDPTNQAIYGKYYVDNTPEVYVLNPDRIIIGKNLKVDQIEEVIEKDKSNN